MGQFRQSLAGYSWCLRVYHRPIGLSVVISRLSVVKINIQDHSGCWQNSSSLALGLGPQLFPVSILAH